MYATCLHCHGALGANEEIETFPVGRKLAFDAVKGRLWVVCPSCARWNLSPLEERWEATEWCERTYRESTMRVATDEIGLARLRSGLEIVRIGKPLRPELAAWRYGRSLNQRHRQAWLERIRQRVSDDPHARRLVTGAMIFSSPALLVGLTLLGTAKARRAIRRRSAVEGVRVGGVPLSFTVGDLDGMRLTADHPRGWNLRLAHAAGHTDVEPEDALRLLGRLLVHVNDTGGSPRQVELAVAKLEHFRTPDALLRFMARRNAETGGPLVTALGYEQRLAVEMVAHEESERRALEGELAALATAWREAEEVAAIADDLLLPQRILRRLGRHP